MLPRLFQNSNVLIGLALILLISFTEATDDAFPILLDDIATHHEVRRNPKFIIPSILSHIYQKADADSVVNSILCRPFAKKQSDQSICKNLEHKPAIGNNRREHLSQLKTKSPSSKLLGGIENQGTDMKTGKEGENLQNVVNDVPFEVKRGFSGLKKWYGEPPMIWAPPIPFPNSYMVPYQQIANSPAFSNYHESIPHNPMENYYLQGGVVHKPLSRDGLVNGKIKVRDMNGVNVISGDEQKLDSSKSHTSETTGYSRPSPQQTDNQNNSVVAQERKFVITNITKYVLDFYCPHCGGEISVSRAKNRNSYNRGDEITVNKGAVNKIGNKLEAAKEKIITGKTEE